ncbi:MAG TPA: type II secretion system protein GspK [Polyangiaceae bacterium]|nr:type II secretion system protein GspK [Polyangiaceae bacterium]
MNFPRWLTHFVPNRRVRRAARRRARGRRRGMAFVLVLGALTILTVMLTELQDQSSAELSSALAARDALVAEYAAKSAINLSRLLIASEPTVRKSISFLMSAIYGSPVQIPIWEFSDRMLGAFNDASGTEAFASFSGLDLKNSKNLGLPGASFEITIVDEDSKVNVNAAAANRFTQQRLVGQLMALIGGAQYGPMFEKRDPDGNFSDRQAICAALLDWADRDQDTALCDPTNHTAQEMPAEDSYYELLSKPYHRKNAAFDSLEELRRVRGIGDDFWSTFVDPDPERPDKRLMTVWGQSNAININTAAPQTLIMLVCSNAAEPLPKLCTDPAEMQKFLTILTLARGFTAGAPAFGSPEAFVALLEGRGKGPLKMVLESLGVEPIKFQSAANAKAQMSTESKVFSIYATGIVKSGKRETRTRVHAIIDYRGAPPPGQPIAPTGTGGTSGLGPTPAANGIQTPPTGTGGTDPNALQNAIPGATRPNPAGNVVYFRLD